jgi:PhzF family phenazine biosynthesis protein
MPMQLFQVNAFVETPFEGNPAAVCVLNAERDDAWMQSVALEMNLSETAFIRPKADGFGLRWFTPAIEVDICGHATLASSHILWTEGFVEKSKPVRFHTRSGVLTCVQRGELIELDFPPLPITEERLEKTLVEALDVTPLFSGASKYDKFLVVESEETLRNLKPDFDKLAQVETRGVIVTSRSNDPRFDFVSRFFAPAAGIDEDPVTGSAHCSLAPFWAQRLGKKSMIGFQASSRGGVVHVRLEGDRVVLGGRAVTDRLRALSDRG